MRTKLLVIFTLLIAGRIYADSIDVDDCNYATVNLAMTNAPAGGRTINLPVCNGVATDPRLGTVVQPGVWASLLTIPSGKSIRISGKTVITNAGSYMTDLTVSRDPADNTKACTAADGPTCANDLTVITSQGISFTGLTSTSKVRVDHITFVNGSGVYGVNFGGGSPGPVTKARVITAT